MKKRYSKPDILFESFSLCQNIAAGCEIKPKNPILLMTGVLGDRDGFAFNDSSSCDVDVTVAGGDGDYNGVCYHTFNQNVENPVNVFAS